MIMAACVSEALEYRCTEANTILASATAQTTLRSSTAGCIAFFEYNPIAQNRATGIVRQAISDSDRKGAAEAGSTAAMRKAAASNAPRSASSKETPRSDGRVFRISTFVEARVADWPARTVVVLIGQLLLV